MQRVPTTLGGGQLGYLALDIPTTAYHTIPNARLFIKPFDPGLFAPVKVPTPPVIHADPNPVAPVLSNAEIAQQLSAHNKLIRQYNEI